MSGSPGPLPARLGGAARSGAARSRFPAGLLADLLPADVAVVDALDESFDGELLVAAPKTARQCAFDAEFEALGDAPPGRRQEFARARICAHAAVAALGRPPSPIVMGPRREPRWPPGLVGSITHCPGYRAAAVSGGVLALGIDAEIDQQLPAGVGQLVLTESDRLASDPLAPFGNWDAVAFSARESVFKAWFSVTGRWLDFADATVSLRPDGPLSGGFTASISERVAGVQELAQACGTAELTGRFRRARNLVLTAVTLRHQDQPVPAQRGDAATGGGSAATETPRHRGSGHHPRWTANNSGVSDG